MDGLTGVLLCVFLRVLPVSPLETVLRFRYCRMHVQRNGVQLMKSMVMDDVGEGEVRCLVDVAKQFKHWHQSLVRGDRIAAALWGEAVRRCQEHTPQRVAYVLRIALAGVM